MPQEFPPHRSQIRRQPGPEPQSISAFQIFRKAVYRNSLYKLGLRLISSSPRRTCSTHRHCKPTCNAGIPAVQNTLDKMCRHVRRWWKYLQKRFASWVVPHLRSPVLRRDSLPASRLLSRPSGYNTTTRAGGRTGRESPFRNQSNFGGGYDVLYDRNGGWVE
jgi:hypothetical protein